ncbi:hypothetical protein CLAFUR0_20038, partial [Fulvia fulva]
MKTSTIISALLAVVALAMPGSFNPNHGVIDKRQNCLGNCPAGTQVWCHCGQTAICQDGTTSVQC